MGKALDISGRRPRETQFLGACSALAWSTVAGRRYLGSFTPNVETECWHNFRRRRWRAQLTPFHASATIPLSLSLSRSRSLFSCFIHGAPDQVGRKKENLNRCWKLEQNRQKVWGEKKKKSFVEINFRDKPKVGESAKLNCLRVNRTGQNYSPFRSPLLFLFSTFYFI